MRLCLKYEGLGRLKKMVKLTRLPPNKSKQIEGLYTKEGGHITY